MLMENYSKEREAGLLRTETFGNGGVVTQPGGEL